MQSRDPSTNVVLLEDAAAVLGVILAAGCMGLTSLTGKQKRHCSQAPIQLLHGKQLVTVCSSHAVHLLFFYWDAKLL